MFYLQLKRYYVSVGGFEVTVFSESFIFSTGGEIDFVDLTSKVEEVVKKSGVTNGTVHVFASHSTGVLVLIEFEPSLLNDIKHLLEKMIPNSETHRNSSNAHSHLRSLLLNSDKTLPVIDSHVILGTGQSLVFIETDMHRRQRNIIIQVLGE